MNRSMLMSCLVVLALACDGGGGTDGGVSADGGGVSTDGGTTLTLAGAVTGTVNASAPTTLYTPATDLGEFDIRANVAGVATQVAFSFPGAPTLKTYTAASSDAGINCSLQIYVNDGGLDGWAANFGAGLPDLGACALTLTSATVSADHGTQKNYAVHGSMTATAEAHAGAATGSVTYSASF